MNPPESPLQCLPSPPSAQMTDPDGALGSLSTQVRGPLKPVYNTLACALYGCEKRFKWYGNAYVECSRGYLKQ